MIDNYPEGQVEYLEAPNNMENEELEPERSRSVENFILNVMILWQSLLRNTNVSILEMKFVL